MRILILLCPITMFMKMERWFQKKSDEQLFKIAYFLSTKDPNS